MVAVLAGPAHVDRRPVATAPPRSCPTPATVRWAGRAGTTTDAFAASLQLGVGRGRRRRQPDDPALAVGARPDHEEQPGRRRRRRRCSGRRRPAASQFVATVRSSGTPRRPRRPSSAGRRRGRRRSPRTPAATSGLGASAPWLFQVSAGVVGDEDAEAANADVAGRHRLAGRRVQPLRGRLGATARAPISRHGWSCHSGAPAARRRRSSSTPRRRPSRRTTSSVRRPSGRRRRARGSGRRCCAGRSTSSCGAVVAGVAERRRRPAGWRARPAAMRGVAVRLGELRERDLRRDRSGRGRPPDRGTTRPGDDLVVLGLGARATSPSRRSAKASNSSLMRAHSAAPRSSRKRTPSVSWALVGRRTEPSGNRTSGVVCDRERRRRRRPPGSVRDPQPGSPQRDPSHRRHQVGADGLGPGVADGRRPHERVGCAGGAPSTGAPPVTSACHSSSRRSSRFQRRNTCTTSLIAGSGQRREGVGDGDGAERRGGGDGEQGGEVGGRAEARALEVTEGGDRQHRERLGPLDVEPDQASTGRRAARARSTTASLLAVADRHEAARATDGVGGRAGVARVGERAGPRQGRVERAAASLRPTAFALTPSSAPGAAVTRPPPSMPIGSRTGVVGAAAARSVTRSSSWRTSSVPSPSHHTLTSGRMPLG